MTVEDKKVGLAGGEGAVKDLFPVGMRVLAVDDDPTCLIVLERFLRSCKYQVTTTNQAIKALEMLRENRDKFDLVISDVNMPDMDGFKLLELVGLEMDLPVIMLSSHSDPKLVMKGITHGACDYLLKPVRIEEIKNIWQHVVRRKFSTKDRSKLASTERPYGQEGGNGAANVANGDPTAKLNKKRKDQNDEEDDDNEDTGHDDEDPSTQKKPRVVWSVELHRKFVTAVNQLGLEKAVPKKILDLMNVEGLTRENVASHLQKYRLYLKRLSNVASQQANIVAALGSKDPSYIRMSPLDRFGDFRTLVESRRLSNISLSSYPPSGMLGRLNTPANLSTRGITTSGLGHQPNLPENMSGSVSTTMGKLQQGTMPGSQNASFFPVIPSMEFNQMQQSKPATHVGEFSGIDDPTKCGVATTITDDWRTDSSSSNISVYNQTSSHAFLRGSQQKTQNKGNHEIRSSVGGGSAPFSSLHVDRGGSSYKDPHDSWQGGEQLHGLPSVNSLPPGGHAQLPLSNGGNNSFHIHDNRRDFSTNLAVSGSLENSRGDAQCQAGLLGNVVSSLSYARMDRLGEHDQSCGEVSSQSFARINSLAGVSASVPICSGGPSEDPRTTFCNRNSDFSQYGQQLIGQSTLQHTQVGSSSINSNSRCSENYFTDQAKDGIYQTNYSLDELMDAVIKQEHNESILMDGNMGFDLYPLGSCI